MKESPVSLSRVPRAIGLGPIGPGLREAAIRCDCRTLEIRNIGHAKDAQYARSSQTSPYYVLLN